MALTELDRFEAPCGPCAFCGHPDKRHRVWDTWLGMAEAGDTAESIADNYEVPIEYVKAVLRVRPYQESED